MAVYGSNFYGSTQEAGLYFKYGREALVEFNASPFIAQSVDYGKIIVSWQPPSGDWDSLRLVRNTFGFPVTVDDGDLLIVAENGAAVSSYIDQGAVPNNAGLIPGRTYYYSVFVRRTSDQKWFEAGSALAVSVKNYGTADTMYEYLPLMYKVLNISSVLDNVSEVNPDLYNFIRIFAFEHDLFKTLADSVKNKYDVLNVDGRLIPVMLDQFGFAYEKELGLHQGRRLLQNAAEIYSKKGSVSGLKTFVSAFTGYNCTLGAPINLMLTIDDSSFEDTTGFWYAPNSDATLSSISGASESPSVSPYEEAGAPSGYPNSKRGLLKMAATASANIALYAGNTSKAKTQGVPVVSGQTYSFTIYSRAKTTTRTIKTNINWYDRNGALLTNAGEVSSTGFSTSAWVRTTAVTGVAPNDAAFAIPFVTVASAANGEIHYFDAAQFEKASSASTYTDARRIDIYLAANRVNQIKNPSFEVNITNWTIAGGTGAKVTSAPAGVSGTSSLKITASASTATVTSDYFMSAIAGDVHAFSAYVKGPVTDTAQLKISWYTSSDTLISTSSATATLLTTSWARLSMVATAPANAAKAKVVVQYATTSGNEVFVDALLFEKASYVQPYFDGSTGYGETADLVWENNSNVNGAGLYYKNRANAVSRLSTVVSDYLPNRAPFAIFIGTVV